ncbi:hypothetical protein GF337_14520, partial [candidate division KSB1 bacterium]|nr:hypothetical protein [candidate division KSB1 bacterium]
MYTIDLIQTENNFAKMQQEWNALLRDSVSASVFTTWDWLFSWWQTFKGSHQLFILKASDKDGRLVGLAPFFIKKIHCGIRILSFIGSDSSVASDYLDIIVHRDVGMSLRKELFQYIFEQRKEWHLIVLSNLMPGSPTVEALKLIREVRELAYEEQ